MKTIFLISLCISFLAISDLSFAQDVSVPPDTVPDMLGAEQAGGMNFARMLQMDLMQRFLNAQQQAGQNQPTGTRTRPRASRPEAGPMGPSGPPGPELPPEPVDLSKYIGPSGDAQKTWDQLQQSGKVPPSSSPQDNTDAQKTEKAWLNVPAAKRLDHAQDLIDRRRFDEALLEAEAVLNTNPKEDEKIRALLIREKALFHQRYHDTVQNDYYRLKAYYPKEKRIDQLKDYLEEHSGIAKLQEQVKNNPQDPVAQSMLLAQYLRYGWLDFAEEFFAQEIQDTSEATVKSLSDIYYRKQDYPMLVELSRTAEELYPEQADYPYNEGVGLYMMGDPLSIQLAKQSFQEALEKSPSPYIRQGLNWYLKRLANVK